MNRACKLLSIPVGLLLLVLSVEAARHRLVDADEAFYLLAARLVFQHKLPYLDFLYTQMPLLPYIYGLWMQFWGESWLTARVFSASLTTALGVLLYLHVCARTGKWAAAILAVLLFSGTTLIFGWLPIVKTYALSSLLLFASYMLAIRIPALPSRWIFFLCGLFLGLSVEVRLYLAAVIPVFLLWIWRHRKLFEKTWPVLWFLGGLGLSALPAMWLLARNPGAYIFNNVGIHAIRSDGGLIGGFGQKLMVIVETLIGGPRGNGLQLSILLVVSVWLFRKKKMADPERLAFQLAVVLALICLAPTPSYVQYFSVIVPFLLAAAVCSFGNLPVTESAKEKALLTAGICMGTLLYFATSMPDYRKYFITGEGLNGIYLKKDPGNWTLAAVSAVSRNVDELAIPGERVMSFWPGYIFASKANVYPGFENDCGRILSTALSAQQLTNFHVASPPAIESDIATKIPRIVVVGNQEYWHESKQRYVEVLERSRYVVARRIGDTSIYVRSDLGVK